MIFLFMACRATATVSVSELGFLVIPRSRRRRGISHCVENTQSEILRSAQNYRSEIPRCARNDSVNEVLALTLPP